MLKYALLKLRNKLRVKKNNQIILSKTNRIRYCDIRISGSNNKLIFDDGANLKNATLEIEGEDCQIKIGKACVIGENTYLSARGKSINLLIGDNCMFSRNVKIMTSDGHDIFQKDQKINPSMNISIGNHVWLADSATAILKNTEL